MKAKQASMLAHLYVESERQRQQRSESWSTVHDDHHANGELALMAAAFAVSSTAQNSELAEAIQDRACDYLGDGEWFKPKAPLGDLVRAGALILAEIERRLRANEQFE